MTLCKPHAIAVVLRLAFVSNFLMTYDSLAASTAFFVAFDDSQFGVSRVRRPEMRVTASRTHQTPRNVCGCDSLALLIVESHRGIPW